MHVVGNPNGTTRRIRRRGRFLSAVLLAAATIASYACTEEDEGLWTCLVTSAALGGGTATGTGTGSTESEALREAELDACDKLGISDVNCLRGGNVSEACQYSGGGLSTAASPR